MNMKIDELFTTTRKMLSYVEQDIREIVASHVKFQAETLNDLIPFERIVFIGYTPTFNDGEECVHINEIGYKHFTTCNHRSRMMYPDCLDFGGVFREVCGDKLADEFQDGYSYSEYLHTNNLSDTVFDPNDQHLIEVWSILTRCISETLRIGLGTNYKAIVDVNGEDVTCTLYKIDPDEWYNEATPCI